MIISHLPNKNKPQKNVAARFGDLRINNTNKKQDNALEKYRIATFLAAVT